MLLANNVMNLRDCRGCARNTRYPGFVYSHSAKAWSCSLATSYAARWISDTNVQFNILLIHNIHWRHTQVHILTNVTFKPLICLTSWRQERTRVINFCFINGWNFIKNFRSGLFSLQRFSSLVIENENFKREKCLRFSKLQSYKRYTLSANYTVEIKRI